MPQWPAAWPSLGLPTVVVMEGGYAVEALGSNVAEFLNGFSVELLQTE